MPLIFLFTLLASLVSCQSEYLSVQTHYLNRSDLASFHIDTPDPQLHFPLDGQRLLVQWSLPAHFSQYELISLKIVVRFGNRSEMVKDICLDSLSGYYLYDLTGQEYFDLQGIKTYKVDLLVDGQVIETWQHQLWAQLIKVGS